MLESVIFLSYRLRRITPHGEGLNVRDWLYAENHCKSVDTTESELILPTVIRALEIFTDAEAIGYTVDGTPLNLSDKDKKWLELKDTFKF